MQLRFLTENAVRRLLWLVLTCSCYAQTNGALPRLYQSMPQGVNSNPANKIVLPDGVKAGQLIVTCSTNNSANGITMSDTDGNTYTQQTLFAINGSGNSYMQQAYAVAAHTVSSLTITGTPGGSGSGFQTAGLSSVGIYDGLSGTPDGTGSTTALASGGSIGTSVTTTTNGDGVIACASLDGSSGLQHGTGSPAAGTQYAVRDNYANSFQTYKVGGAAGSQTITDLIAGGTNTNYGMFVTAFKPAANAVATTALADCGNGILCVQQLRGVGGTAAYTWSVTAGSWPTGCSNASLNSSTGLISCTPTANGTFSLTFQWSDGTVTASRALSLTVGATLATPTINGTPVILPGNGGVATINVKCPSDIVLFVLHGSDSHGTHGWKPPIDGANNNISSSGLTALPVNVYGGSGNAAIQAYMFGPFGTFGAHSFTLNVNTSSAIALSGWAIDISGVQPEIDDAVTSGAVDSNSSGTYNITSSYTSLVPNQLLIQMASDDQDGGITAPNDTFSMSPLSIFVSSQSNGGYDNSAVGSYLIASPSTVSTTTSITHPSSQENSGLLQFALRPAITVAESCVSFQGEKVRPQRF